MMISSPYSTRSRSIPSLFFASKAPISTIHLRNSQLKLAYHISGSEMGDTQGVFRAGRLKSDVQDRGLTSKHDSGRSPRHARPPIFRLHSMSKRLQVLLPDPEMSDI